MSRTVHVDGAWVPEAEARISVFDRGFLFADAVYEVTAVLDGRLVDFPGHVARLARSLAALEIAAPVSDAALEALHREIVARNGLRQGIVYVQVTRGAADRDFVMPATAQPALVLFTQARELIDTAAARDGLRVVTAADLRWGRRDIKTVQLLAASLAKTEARRAGADDVWLVEDGLVTEGSSSNAWIVTRDGRIITRGLAAEILGGITRAAVLRLAGEAGLEVAARPFSVAEAAEAAEAFMTAASAFVTPVVEIDRRRVGDGRPGPLTRRLQALYLAEAFATAR